jgi:hypothetical protein
MLNRAAHAILVPGAHSMAGIGVVRSLGAAGYRVHAAAEDPAALGLRSRFATASVVHPPLRSAAFADWFADYVRRHAIEMLTPGVFGYQPGGVFGQYPHLYTTPVDPVVLGWSRSKAALFEKLGGGSGEEAAHLPPYRLVDLDRDLPDQSELARLGEPLFIKTDASEARCPAPSEVLKCRSARECRDCLEALAPRYRRVLVQGYVPGRGAGAFLLRWNGKTVARMMHLRLHEMPHTGGASSFRVSWWHEKMMCDAECKLAAIGWQGVAMVEYRWDPSSDAFHLMEMNLRFWGSLHLALFAGVDFPRLLADAFFGHLPVEPVTGRPGVYCRNTIPYEIGYLVSLWRDPEVPKWRKAHSLIEAILLSFDPRVHNDLWFPGDRMLFFRRLGASLAGGLGRGGR